METEHEYIVENGQVLKVEYLGETIIKSGVSNKIYNPETREIEDYIPELQPETPTLESLQRTVAAMQETVAAMVTLNADLYGIPVEEADKEAARGIILQVVESGAARRREIESPGDITVPPGDVLFPDEPIKGG